YLSCHIFESCCIHSLPFIHVYPLLTSVSSCCTRYTKKKLPCLLVKNYSIQTIHGSCDINAIIFHVNGRFVCADPTKAWTKRAVTSCLFLYFESKSQAQNR
uniref:C-C motif chemokine n=1 Tax=Poecilia latipinna TaxID=48699 RepID=A0A3B3VU67_9TELE